VPVVRPESAAESGKGQTSMADTARQDDDKELPSMSPDTVIGGKYRIDQMIGRGGMGSVWSAVHLGLGQRVAIKLISRRYANSREARHRFDIEAKAAAQLRSRHVVQVFDNGETSDGTPYIVMELLEGESLDQRISRGPLAIDDALRILTQVGRALSRAHSVGIIHRDLKPENIFLTHGHDDDGEIAKVLDFGIAKIKTQDGSDSATRTGAVLGTPLFMSPEQARALRSVDHRTDVYSFGIVAYTMLTGKPAFNGESFGDILVAICTHPLPSMRAAAPWLPAGVDDWLGRACARDPAQRFASIEQAVTALCAALGMPRSPSANEVPPQGSSGLEVRIPPGTHLTPPAYGSGSGSGSSNEVAPVPPERRTTSGLMVSGEDIPKRSLAPLLLGVAGVLIVAAVAVVFLLRRSSPLSPEPSTATSPDTTPSAAPSASAVESSHNEVAAAPDTHTGPKSGAAASASAANVPPPRPPSRPVNVPLAPARPPMEMKPVAKPPVKPDNKPPVKPTKPGPDLGF
jgi:serine/threonine-protein kinase